MMTDISRLVIYGGGELGHEIAEYACECFGWSQEDPSRILFIDRTLGLTSINPNWRVVHSISSYISSPGDKFIIGVGIPEIREKLLLEVESYGYQLCSIIHPSAYVSKFAKVDVGVIVSPFCTVSTNALLSKNVIINTYTAVGHHVTIGENSVLSPKVLCAGGSKVGKNVFIGSGAVIVPKISIGSFSKITAGSVVHRNAPNDCLVAGNPAKIHLLKSEGKNV